MKKLRKRWSDKTYFQRTFIRICLFIGWMVTILMILDYCSEKIYFETWMCCWKWITICPVHEVLRINLQFLCCVCAKVGQISPEVRLIACQKHFYDASKNINFAFEHCCALSIILIKHFDHHFKWLWSSTSSKVFKVHLLQNFCSTLRT